MGFRVGTVVNVDNALKMMLVKSANDIAMALAETIGGSESGFVAMMNAEARRLGMASTHYDNPNGLPDDGQITTARDLAVLARALWLNFPEQPRALPHPGDPRRQAHPALGERAAGALSRRQRHEDRLRLRLGLQHRGHGQPGRPPADGRRARRRLVQESARRRPASCSTGASATTTAARRTRRWRASRPSRRPAGGESARSGLQAGRHP